MVTTINIKQVAEKLINRGYIKLTADHFMDVNSAANTFHQYGNPGHCPIARSVASEFKIPCAVLSGCVMISKFRRVIIYGSSAEVERCRKSLSNGAKYAKIRVFKSYNDAIAFKSTIDLDAKGTYNYWLLSPQITGFMRDMYKKAIKNSIEFTNA